MKLFDVHTHVQFAAFKDDKEEVIRRALDSGILMINIGTQRDTSQTAIDLAKKYETGVWATVGLHPIHTARTFHDAQELGSATNDSGFTSRGEDFDYEQYKKMALDPKTVAIGECGLDYFHLEGDIEDAKVRQKEAFLLQMKLAKEVGKPLMIHCRDAFPDLLRILKDHSSELNDLPGVAHFFAGTPEEAREMLQMGFYFTFGGAITFPHKPGKGIDYAEIIKLLPPDRILSETDAPYLAPVPFRGKRNEPLYVIEVVKKLAELKGMELGEMKEQIWQNAQRVFKIS